MSNSCPTMQDDGSLAKISFADMTNCDHCPMTLELDAVFSVSQSMARSEDVRATLQNVLQNLQAQAAMDRGMVTLVDPKTGELILQVLHGLEPYRFDAEVKYSPGEGIVGTIFQDNRVITVPRIANEPRFVDKLGVYDAHLPFVGVPIHLGGETIGVLAAQPSVDDPTRLKEQTKFLEMMANLVGQVVRITWKMEQDKRTLTDQRDRLLQQVSEQYSFDRIIGHSDAMQRVFDQIRAVAKWTTTVLIRGESGTGKELVAHAIHYNSPRAEKPFVKLNAAALSDQLLESELFGHEKGAFTGALESRPGRFEQAHGGTLFLDEIGEISPGFQAKLLRVLQEGEFERVGSSETKVVDVRVIAATNRDLESEVEQGKFREDLYYRLNVMPIHMPSLRARIEDLPDLSRHLLSLVGERQGRHLSLTKCAIRLLMRYDWPGNVRELENCLERAAIMAPSEEIDREVLVLAGLEDRVMDRGGTIVETPANFDDPELDERERIIAALEHCGWVQAKAARLLGMTARQIAYRIQMFDINVRKL